MIQHVRPLRDALIHFRCGNPAHARLRAIEPTLTIREGLWAYCGSGQTCEHRWRRTRGVVYQRTLVRPA